MSYNSFSSSKFVKGSIGSRNGFVRVESSLIPLGSTILENLPARSLTEKKRDEKDPREIPTELPTFSGMDFAQGSSTCFGALNSSVLLPPASWSR